MVGVGRDSTGDPQPAGPKTGGEERERERVRHGTTVPGQVAPPPAANTLGTSPLTSGDLLDSLRTSRSLYVELGEWVAKEERPPR